MDIPVQMIIIYNLKYRHAIRLKFRDKFLISLAKLKLEAKASTGQCFTIRESLLWYCRKFSTYFVAVVI